MHHHHCQDFMAERTYLEKSFAGEKSRSAGELNERGVYSTATPDYFIHKVSYKPKLPVTFHEYDVAGKFLEHSQEWETTSTTTTTCIIQCSQ